ncbi:MAG: ATP-binding protein [bacterium]|nr:ATP-binding protein [bacterium]
MLGTLELNLQPVNLSIWLPQVLIHWREAAKDKKQTWQITIPNDLPPILVDSQRLAQAIGNLVSNAIKYTPVGGSITISAGSNKQETWIQVRDSGFGISAEEQAHIFEPFFRGGEEQRIKQGMGLGLSIAHNLVVAHNGRIEVESAVNQGSEFTIWLPKDPLTEPNT